MGLKSEMGICLADRLGEKIVPGGVRCRVQVAPIAKLLAVCHAGSPGDMWTGAGGEGCRGR